MNKIRNEGKTGYLEELPFMYKEFKTIYKQGFGIAISDKEAYDTGNRLLTLAKAIVY